ncbi:HNH endonuclease [Mycobacterium phage ThulaThula]|uniref:HNH endonuclease n=1 Tax=Mycobacterium phage ThulaThula TaxID=2599880 RepID=A0A5J6TES0_9CAUD|nr:HNH endonuclease [Mycobacterium phage ThulaThula]QFG09105.1 HNH endonuclease [Mycobacterium phage ThulaThula]
MQRAGRKANTTDKGLGWRHQQDAARLLRRHENGTLCWWCGLPMFKSPLLPRNWDGKQLAADHTQPRAFGGKRADRLLHGNCNSQRRDGRLDHVRPALLGCHPRDWAQALAAQGISTALPQGNTDTLAMDW